MMLISFSGQAQIKKYKKWEQAVEIAKSNSKDILIILTGKEWCAPCLKLEKNVLVTEQFAEYADPKFVIFEIDIPKSHLSKTNSPVVKKHELFSTKYKATAFPSLILVDQAGIEKIKVTESSWELEELLVKFKTVYANDNAKN
jgi:thioredoxin-related protein